MQSSQPIEAIRPPRPKGHWAYGDTFEMLKNPLNVIKKRQAEMGDMFEADILVHKVMFATHPEVAKHLLLDNHKNYYKSFDYEILKLVLGDGLISSDGEFWRKQRRLAQPAFHKARIENMFNAMLEAGLLMCERMEEHRKAGKVFDLSLEMTTVTVSIVAKTLFGTKLELSMKSIGDTITNLNGYIAAKIRNPLIPPTWVPVPKNIWFKREMKSLDQLIYKIISDRRANPEKGDDLLDMLMDAQDEESGSGMTDLQLRDEILTLFLAGHETSATSLCWTMILLSKNPEIMAMAKQEVEEQLGDKIPALEDLAKLPYLKRIIDEALRLYPPAWIVGRRALEDDIVNGFLVPKGFNVIVSTYMIHRHPEFWEEPEKFDPDRFLPERSQNRHKYAYFPFGGGPRMCIGNGFAIMEMTLLLALILQRFTPKAAQADWELDPLVTLRPKGPVPFRF